MNNIQNVWKKLHAELQVQGVTEFHIICMSFMFVSKASHKQVSSGPTMEAVHAE